MTVIFRSFAGEEDTIGWLNPSYSLYPILAEIQGANQRFVELDDNFELPEDLAEQAKGCGLFLITNPNAPTTNSFCKEKIREFCKAFHGIVVIDEAYGDFAETNCLELYKEFQNVIVTRTFSKSYSLAGIRVGMAFANTEITAGMHKLKTLIMSMLCRKLWLPLHYSMLTTSTKLLTKLKRHALEPS